jgi:hypothetical protein
MTRRAAIRAGVSAAAGVIVPERPAARLRPNP